MRKMNFQTVQKYAIYIILAFVILLFSLLTNTFLQVNNAINILRQIAALAVMSVGMSFVMIAGGIDLSIGSAIGLSGIVIASLMVKLGWNPVICCVIGVLVNILVGLINGLIITKTRMAPLIATLGMMTALKGLTYILCNGVPVYGFAKSFSILGQGSIARIPVSAIIMVVVLLTGSFILRKTYVGRYFYAIGSNEEAARLAGINTDKIRILGYSLCGFFCGIASIVMLSRVNSGQPSTGTGMEMDVITAIVLGGVSTNGGEGNMRGMFVGVLIMGILNNGLLLVGLNEYYQQLVKGLVLILAVGFDSVSKLRAAKSKATL